MLPARLLAVLAVVLAFALTAAPASAAPVLRTGSSGAAVSALNVKLASLGYLPAGSAGSAFTQATHDAVVAFQKWHGLARDGAVGSQTSAALATAARPQPLTSGSGRRIEVSLTRQVALLIRDGRVQRTIAVSTGAAGYRTPAGAFRIYRKEIQSWSVPYRVWLPYASYFVGGVAFHGYASVPSQPASHGCVRVPLHAMAEVYAFAAMGTPVRVV